MKKINLSIFLVAVLFIFGYSNILEIKNVPTVIAAPVSQSHLMGLINEKRIKNGKKPLVQTAALNKGAYQRAVFSKTHNQWSHKGYVSAIQLQLKNKTGDVGENLGRYQISDEQILADWLGSPIHKEVMLQPFTYGGIGHYQDYWVLWMSTEL